MKQIIKENIFNVTFTEGSEYPLHINITNLDSTGTRWSYPIYSLRIKIKDAHSLADFISLREYVSRSLVIDLENNYQCEFWGIIFGNSSNKKWVIKIKQVVMGYEAIQISENIALELSDAINSITNRYPKTQDVDPLAGAKRRTDENLRRLFGYD